VGWLRAAVLGANDGIISIASLVVGRSIRSFVRWQRMTAPIDLTH
jgi:VIT1/CCC1 family predicted Fe2+/Mn2+ transporter